MQERRPTPEEMLKRAAMEESRSIRGRLKIFFGASPGVGKTYAMLEAARARKRQGADVVIGLIETHGRKDTEALTEGLEMLTPRSIEHRGVVLREFDLDAALARRPTVLLIDELAHSNAPGSRHARRWQDVEELLDEGIEVWTTLNVQHVESLNDVVAQITGVKVQETVPDSTIDLADEIELVDLSPDDLLERLRDGKVYIPAQAERALQSFFRKGNLIALRELALRRTAEHVDAQAAEWKIEQGINRPWPTRERLLVAVNHRPQSADVIRAGRRAAERLRAPWIVLTVETPAFDRLVEEERERVAEHLALAQRLGAETLVVRGESVVEEILAAAREHRVTRIVVGRPQHPAWRDWIGRSRIDELVRGAGSIEVLVTTGEKDDLGRTRARRRQAPKRATEYALALVTVLASTLICLATRRIFGLADQVMIYLLGVLVAASGLARAPSLLAALASVAALDFFFVPPYMTFAIGDMRYGLTFVVMLIVGIMVSSRTVLIREQALTARDRERRTTSLYAMSREFAVEEDPSAIARHAVIHVRDLVECDAVVLVANAQGELEPIAGGGSSSLDTERERAVARWVFDNGRPAGYGTDTLPATSVLFLPMSGSVGPLGVFGVDLGARASDPTPAQRQLLETFVAQTALALERVKLRAEASKAKVAIETERLRSALLSTVSHDLRTPLASISGAAQVLVEPNNSLGPQARMELLQTIREESERLNRLVANLLEMTRIESGSLQVHKEWCPVEELVDSAIDRMQSRLVEREITTHFPEKMLLAPVDPTIFEQVLVNLIENAAKYSPRRAPIEISARAERNEIVFEVADRGPGIPAGEEERIFEKFHRIGDGRPGEGAGLGLAVCKAIVAAHGGWIKAANQPGGGARFTFGIPNDGGAPNVELPSDGGLPDQRTEVPT